ncbi:MAG: hypothetical protein IPI58_07660 [Alphaproteobacteria bacterium]|nr:MAG: hypothetical protein IPI58_07660 [Alphaproteobacteria bacterium]
MCAETVIPPRWASASESGIAIGPILWVVAILAVLAAAIAAGSGVFNGDISAVKAKAQASAILEQANLLTIAVQRVVGHGCTDTQISFENPMVSGYVNSNAPSDKSCHVFDVNGGGINFPTITASTSDTTDGGKFVFEGSATFHGLGELIPDLVGYLPIDSLDLCKQLNTGLGLGGYLGQDLYRNPSDLTRGRFTGQYVHDHYSVDDGGAWPQGKVMGCVEKTPLSPTSWPATYYFFFVVLMAR